MLITLSSFAGFKNTEGERTSSLMARMIFCWRSARAKSEPSPFVPCLERAN